MPTPVPCAPLDVDDPVPVVRAVDLIVIATVDEGDDGLVRLRPEAYLKGAANRSAILLDDPAKLPCRAAPLADGATVLAFLDVSQPGGAADWPIEGRLFALEGGFAVAPSVSLLERDLVGEIRDITGQFAVPAGDEGGISFDLWGNIVPVSITLVFIFAVGLVLMRLWHAIDPS